MGVHKDSSLGFQYVDPNVRRQNIATRLQTYIANQMLKNNRILFFMVSLHNEVALNFQKKLAQPLPQNYFISVPKAHMN